MKRANRPSSSARRLSVRQPEETPSSEEQERAESGQDRADVAAMAQKQAAEQASDKIGSVVDYGPYVVDHSPTQVFGLAVIDMFDGQVSRIPKWRFKRWYFRDKIIIDFFRTKQEYEAADVEARRDMARKFKVRYAALGPGMSYKTDLPQQLGIRK